VGGGGSDFVFKFQMLRDWVASQEGFSIKWRQVFRTCRNNLKKNLVRNLFTKLNVESKYGEFFFFKFRKTGVYIYIFGILAKFRTQKMNKLGGGFSLFFSFS